MAISGGEHGLQPGSNAVLATFTPEFRLMLLCMRWPLGVAGLACIAERAEDIADWPHLLALTRRHRVLGLVVARAQALRMCGAA